MKKYNKTVKKRIILFTLCIALIYTGIYYCLKLYYKPEAFDLISDNNLLEVSGTYLDSPIDSKVVINSIYCHESVNSMEIETKSYKLYVYDENDNLLIQSEKNSDNLEKLNNLLSSESLIFDKRLKSNNIFDHHYQTLSLILEYGEKNDQKINSNIKVYE